MKLIFLILLLVSAVYSSGVIFDKCGTIQSTKCNAFARAGGRECICSAEKKPSRSYCHEADEKVCRDIPGSKTCIDSQECPQSSTAYTACVGFCSKEGGMCDPTQNICGALQALET